MVAAVLAYLETLGPGAGYLILLLAAGFVFLCMAVFSLAGGEAHDSGMDLQEGSLEPAPLDAADGGADGADAVLSDGDAHEQGVEIFKYLSFRNCINYLLGFGLCGFLAARGGAHPMVGALAALSGGFISAVLMYKLMAALYSLSDTQPLLKQDALGETARVYIQIGPKRSGHGKILLKVKGAQREFSAVTDAEHALRAGTRVRVTGMEKEWYVVAPLEKEDVQPLGTALRTENGTSSIAKGSERNV